MNIPEYKYSLAECDVPENRRSALDEYRKFRRGCLESMRGPANTSVMNQIHNLVWYTAVFRTLKEARRLEPERLFNRPLWKLTTIGHANLISLGIRKLVDRDKRSDSLWYVIEQIKQSPELLTRENYVCYDGLPYDYEAAYQASLRELPPEYSRLPTTGPEAWQTSKLLHENFDKLSGVNPTNRKREDKIEPYILTNIEKVLSEDTISKVRTLVDKKIAHAERLRYSPDPIPKHDDDKDLTYDDIDQALRQIVRVAKFLATSIFYDAAFSIMPTPQYDALEGLDQPWITKENIPALHKYRVELSRSIDAWANHENDYFYVNAASK